jgi:hypothetical protein
MEEEIGNAYTHFMKTNLIADLCRYPRILLKWILDKQEV